MLFKEIYGTPLCPECGEPIEYVDANCNSSCAWNVYRCPNGHETVEMWDE